MIGKVIGIDVGKATSVGQDIADETKTILHFTPGGIGQIKSGLFFLLGSIFD